jgi:hypothetical protein
VMPSGRMLRWALVALLAASVTIAALWPDGDDASEPGPIAYDRTFAGLCDGVAAAGAGSLDRALGLFLRQSHTGLHELAAALSDADRRAAARLLEAKAAVEESLPARSASAEEDLAALLEATAAGIAIADGSEAPTC